MDKRSTSPVNHEVQAIGSSPFNVQQQEEDPDISLKKIWGRIRQLIDFAGTPEPMTSKEICIFLSDPANAPLINQITSLCLAHLELTVLPSEIGKLTALRHLNLEHNNLKTIPAEIGNLISLNELNLSCNLLDSIPSETSNLTQLNYLYLRCNHLKSLPKGVWNLASLENLSIAYNFELEQPSYGIANLHNLKWFEFGAGCVETPYEISSLEQKLVPEPTKEDISLISEACGEDLVKKIEEGNS